MKQVVIISMRPTLFGQLNVPTGLQNTCALLQEIHERF